MTIHNKTVKELSKNKYVKIRQRLKPSNMRKKASATKSDIKRLRSSKKLTTKLHEVAQSQT
jgi:hypothetical protein